MQPSQPLYASSCRHVLLVCKANHETATLCGQEIAAWLEAEGHVVTVVSAASPSAVYDDPNMALIVVLGGDGTMLGVARHCIGRHTPIFGINFGRVGYLAAAQPKEWRERLADCLAGRLPTYMCMAIRWSVLRMGAVVAQGFAVNDVVVSRGSLSRLLNLSVHIDGVNMGCLRSDGIIVSSPVGSSGYNISAGGPLLAPEAEMYAVTPICPFQRTFAAMIFPGSTVCEFSFSQPSIDCYMTVDGQEGQMLESGDTVQQTGTPAALCFVSRPGGFFEHLRDHYFTAEKKDISLRELP
ncbi:MAG: NAD(+)/NADH kinase [Desulfovibrio sp.]|nr:NAD(+)/NADH kinase [Desulfovibrio sp.]